MNINLNANIYSDVLENCVLLALCLEWSLFFPCTKHIGSIKEILTDSGVENLDKTQT